MKNQKGITLIALVITIIVLLILAGITIAMLTGENGILSKSKSAKAENELGRAKDIINMAASEGIADYYKTVYVDATSTQTYNAKALQEAVVTKLTAATTTAAMNPVAYGTEPEVGSGSAAADITFTITYNELTKTGTIKASGSIEWNS